MPDLYVGMVSFGEVGSISPKGRPPAVDARLSLLEAARITIEQQAAELARLREETRWTKPEEEPAPVEVWVLAWVADLGTRSFWTAALWDGVDWHFTFRREDEPNLRVLCWRPTPSRPDLPELLQGPASPNALTSEADARTSRSPQEIWKEIGATENNRLEAQERGDTNEAFRLIDRVMELRREHREAIARQQEVSLGEPRFQPTPEDLDLKEFWCVPEGHDGARVARSEVQGCLTLSDAMSRAAELVAERCLEAEEESRKEVRVRVTTGATRFAVEFLVAAVEKVVFEATEVEVSADV